MTIAAPIPFNQKRLDNGPLVFDQQLEETFKRLQRLQQEESLHAAQHVDVVKKVQVPPQQQPPQQQISIEQQPEQANFDLKEQSAQQNHENILQQTADRSLGLPSKETRGDIPTRTSLQKHQPHQLKNEEERNYDIFPQLPENKHLQSRLGYDDNWKDEPQRKTLHDSIDESNPQYLHATTAPGRDVKNKEKEQIRSETLDNSRDSSLLPDDRNIESIPQKSAKSPESLISLRMKRPKVN